ncbi:glycerol-3-phosphate phosphatase-like isoform X1 [Onthophagus taurus]|uniref:glycerol-3-phosphate phosphatase-like isoform X1 n=1 Tax=Onthophagus taurus TaxID=166361 RepID=UPI0039BDCD9C
MSLKRSLINIAKLPLKDVKEIFSSFDTVLTDCDGVIWSSADVIKGAKEALDLIRSKGKKLFYYSNNSTRSREMFKSSIMKFGFHCKNEDIISTTFLTAYYLKSINFNKKAYVIGSIGLCKELELVGIKHTSVGPDVLNIKESIYEYVDSFQPDPEIGAVVIGYDIHISLPKLIKASSYLNRPDVLFVATNTDQSYPLTRKDVVLPAVGSIVAAIQAVDNRKPFIIGKPETYALEWLRKEVHVEAKRTLMIGDRLNTDILFGTRCGFQTLLVLTGVTKLEDVEKLLKSKTKEDKDLIPDFYIESIGHLVNILNL